MQGTQGMGMRGIDRGAGDAGDRGAAVLPDPHPCPTDCSQTDPVQSQLREQFEDALRLAERFTRRYDDLLSAFQAEMLNTSSLLDQLNRQFGWVSRLGNLTQGTDGFLQVTTVRPYCPQGSAKASGPPSVAEGKWVRGRKKRLCGPLCTIAAVGLGARAGGGAAWGVRGGLSLLSVPPSPQVFSKTPNLEDPSAPADTQVTVQLFDSDPLSLTVPGDISWDDPRFMEIVAEQALQHFKQNNTM